MADIKYPRIIVSKKRHASLTKESRRREKAGEPGATLEAVAEEKFKIADAK